MSSIVYYMQRFKFNLSSPIANTEVDASTGNETGTEDSLFVVYSILLPIICTLGVIGNILSFLVLLKMEIRCSSYTYLTVKAAADLMCCILILISVIAHGCFYNLDGEDFDLLITLPIASIFSGISVCATVGVTLDRLFVLWKPTRLIPPRACKPEVARRIMAAAIFITVLFNLPYFFMFTLREDMNLHTTKFFRSRYYFIFNWFRFVLYGIVPSIILPIATGLLIVSLKRVCHRLRHLSCKRQTEIRDSGRMSFTLIAIVVFFLVGEFPGHIISKKAAFVFLYSGDVNMVSSNDDLEGPRLIALVLSAINCSINFFLYFMLHPPFGKGLKQLFCKDKSKLPTTNVQVNVFVINKEGDIKKLEKALPKIPGFIQTQTGSIVNTKIISLA